MEVIDVRVDSSPGRNDRARLRATVKYAGGNSEEYWYDMPGSRADELSQTGNPWLAGLLPLAATLGETLTLSLPVDAALHANSARLLRIWKTWYPNLFEPEVHAEVMPPHPSSSGDRVGAFFSGGVDSFFTVLRDRRSAIPAERKPIDDLITVWGFDISLDHADAFARLRERHMPLAEGLDMELIDVATNIRSTRWSEAQWSYLAHGAGLASIVLTLEKRFGTVYIGGGGGYRGLHPWGSHSVTDPLFSTCDTAIVYDGVAYLRTEKLEAIADSPVALEALRVCYETWTDQNCGKCNKCLRTMIGLELCGALNACATLPHPVDLVEKIDGMDCSHFADFRELEDLRGLAVTKGRDDVVAAIDNSMRRAKVRTAVTAGRRALGAPVHRLAKALRPRRD